jgi:MFS family permease
LQVADNDKNAPGSEAEMVDVATSTPTTRADIEFRSLTLVSIAHWVSHFYVLVLPMLYPFLRDRLDADFIALGLSMSVFGLVSGVTQAPLGYVVDRFGARKLLIVGVALGGISFVLLGLHLSYPWLIACGALLGLANSVYHPSDYALLAANIDGKRIGRAFSIHTFSGFFGGAVAPATIAALVAAVGGQGALIAAGGIGIAVALLLIAIPIPEASASAATDSGKTASRVNVLTPAIIVLTAFFMLLGLSNSGISTFGVVALMNGYGELYSTANIALTGYLAASAIGVLAGGYLADRTLRHGQVAVVCFAVNAVIVLVIAVTTPHAYLMIPALLVAGFLSGVIAPSRDMMVRNAAPAGAAGRAFGIVSTGFNISGIISPLLFGFIMDQNMPRWVFGLAGLFMLATVLLTLTTDRTRAQAAVA